MEVLEVTGTDYSTAVEIPVSRERPIAKHQKSNSGNSGSGGKKTSYVPRLAGKALSELQKADQQVTQENRTVMVLRNGKRRFMKASEYERLDRDGKLCRDTIATPRTRTAGITRR